MEPDEARDRFALARVARLATVRPDGSPHLVPVTFAVLGGQIGFAVDAKPKSSRRLQRLRNLQAAPRASLLVDVYDEDWTRLWWVRADGPASIAENGPDLERTIGGLAAKYPQYADNPPDGPAVLVTVERWVGWHG